MKSDLTYDYSFLIWYCNFEFFVTKLLFLYVPFQWSTSKAYTNILSSINNMQIKVNTSSMRTASFKGLDLHWIISATVLVVLLLVITVPCITYHEYSSICKNLLFKIVIITLQYKYNSLQFLPALRNEITISAFLIIDNFRMKWLVKERQIIKLSYQ